MNARNVYLWIGSSCLGIALMISAAYYLSPWIYASSIESAVRSNDLAILARRIDSVGLATSATDVQELVPAGYKLGVNEKIDEGLRAQINLSLKDAIGSDQAFIQKMGNLLSGRGMVTQAVLDQVPKELKPNRTMLFTGESGPTADTYVVRVGFRETGEQVTLILERRGWFTWKAARLSSSGGSVLWPLRQPRGV